MVRRKQQLRDSCSNVGAFFADPFPQQRHQARGARGRPAPFEETGAGATRIQQFCIDMEPDHALPKCSKGIQIFTICFCLFNFYDVEKLASCRVSSDFL